MVKWRAESEKAKNKIEWKAEQSRKKVSLLTVAVATYVSLSVGVCECVLLAVA